MRTKILAMCLLLLPASGSVAASCVENVDALGSACRVPGGFVMTFDDGSTLFTHGGDPMPPPAILGMPLPSAPVQCVLDPRIEPHGVAVYALPVDMPDRHLSMTPDIRAQIETANAWLVAEGSERGAPVSARMGCVGGEIEVLRAPLTTTRDSTTFNSIVTDLKTQGLSNSHEKYWIWLEGHEGLGGFGGFGSIEPSSSAHPSNPNNFGPSYAVTFGYTNARGGWFIQLHEAGHNLGAVQNTAFRSSGAFHCNDGLDIMCYADGGSRSNYTPTVCAVTHFDCGHDDYFNPRPDPGSYLDRSWNVAAPYNRFLAGCAYRAGRIIAPGTAQVSVAGCSGRPFAAAGFLPGHPAGAGPATLTTTRAVLPDVDVCFFSGAVQISCSQTANQPEMGTVPDGATSAVVRTGLSATADYTFSVI